MQENDPMVGWYDRLVARGEHLAVLRNIPYVIGVDVDKYKAHCLFMGYGSQKTMDTLFPEQAQDTSNDH